MIQLKIRLWGTDSTAWSHVFVLEGGSRDELFIVGYGVAQGFPLGHRTKGQLSATMEGGSYLGEIYSAAVYRRPTRPVFDSKPFRASLSIEHRWRPALWAFAEHSVHRDFVLPDYADDQVSLGAATDLSAHCMLDAGVRLGTMRQASTVQGLLGFSLR